MADNAISVSGFPVASDDVGGNQVQRVKATWGADGTATDVAVGSGLPVQTDRLEVVGSLAALNQAVTQEVSGYRCVSVQLSGTFNATVTFEQSNDNTNWQALFLCGTSHPANSASNNMASTGIYSANITSRYFRARCSSFTSGSVTVTAEFFATATPHQQPVYIVGANGSLSVSLSSSGSDGSSFVSVPAVVYNGAAWDRLRTPTTFKSVSANASGNSAVWTPTTSKKFRLLRFKVDVTANSALASAGVLTIGFQDATTDIGVSQDVWLPASAAGAKPSDGWSSGWIDLGNGKLSAAANNVLNINLSAAVTGSVRVICCGTEE